MTTVRIFVAASGNEFMLDIAETFRQGFVQAGCPCEVHRDGLPSPEADDDLKLVLAPHEYFLLSPARALEPADFDAVLRASYLINVEQPGSSWFDLALGYARRARGTFDISREGVSELRARGIAATFAPLGLVPSLSATAQPPIATRAVDVLFIGHASHRRDQFIARHGTFFSNPRCRVVLTDVARPRTSDTPGYFSGGSRLRLLASSRILLNVHSQERTYFESHRALLALANGCLLVTETSRHTEPLREGEHFAMAPLDELAAVCQAYLDDPARLARVAEAGQSFALEAMTMRATCREMLQVFERDQLGGRSATTGRTAATAWSADEARAAVIARLTDADRRRKRGQVDRDLIPNAAYQTTIHPAVSVVVTLYNYQAYIGECLASVVAAEHPPGGLEVVVVDDASTDASGREARQILERASVPGLLVSKYLNTGLADARNVGFEHARGDAVFVLDADNWIYPTCLKTLMHELVDGELAATYGIIQRFSEETGESQGLVSKHEWSVPDLVRGPYIDAMALFRRQAVLDVGGYATEIIEHGWFGWEDYALWLALAQAGARCRLVPVVVAAYREHRESMIHRTNTSTERLARYFEQRFEPLMRQYPGLDRYFGFPSTASASAPVVERPVPQLNQGAELERLRAHCTELQRQLDEFRGSKTWRLTAPFRHAYGLIAGRQSRS